MSTNPQGDINGNNSHKFNSDHLINLTIRGKNLLKGEEYQKAEQVFRDALKIHSRNADNWGNLATTLTKQKRYTDAEQAFKNAVKYNPKDFYSWIGLAQVLEKQKSFGKAKEIYLHSLNLKTRNKSLEALIQNKITSIQKKMEKNHTTFGSNLKLVVYIGLLVVFLVLFIFLRF